MKVRILLSVAVGVLILARLLALNTTAARAQCGGPNYPPCEKEKKPTATDLPPTVTPTATPLPTKTPDAALLVPPVLITPTTGETISNFPSPVAFPGGLGGGVWIPALVGLLVGILIGLIIQGGRGSRKGGIVAPVDLPAELHDGAARVRGAALKQVKPRSPLGKAGVITPSDLPADPQGRGGVITPSDLPADAAGIVTPSDLHVDPSDPSGKAGVVAPSDLPPDAGLSPRDAALNVREAALNAREAALNAREAALRAEPPPSP